MMNKGIKNLSSLNFILDNNGLNKMSINSFCPIKI